MIKINNLSVSYGNRIILNNINFEAKKGRITVVTGKSGSGKTTLMSYISLNKTQITEKYSIDDIEVDLNDSNEIQNIQRNKISYVYQDFELLSNFSIYENIKIAFSMSEESINKNKVLEILRLVSLDDLSLNKKVSKLSGGQKSRLAIAMAIAKNTDYIIMDEPTASLDERNTKIINEIIVNLKNKGKGIIIVSHQPDVFDYDIKYEINDTKLIRSEEIDVCDEDNPSENSNELFNRKRHDLLICNLLKINKLKYLIYILLIGCIVGECSKYMIQGNGIYQEFKAEIDHFEQSEVLIYDSISTTFKEFGLNNPAIDNDVIEQINELSYVKSVYPYYMFGDSDITSIDLSSKNLNYGIELINSDGTIQNTEITLGEIVNIPGIENHTLNEILAFDEDNSKNFILQYQEQIDEGIYLIEEVAEYLHITDVEGLSIRFNVGVPIGTGYSQLWNDNETISESGRYAIKANKTLEYPIKGILSKCNYWIYGGVSNNPTQFYMDYHLMDSIQKTVIQESSKLKTEFYDEDSKYGEFIPLGYVVEINDISKLEELKMELNSLSPTLDCSSASEYYSDNLSSIKILLFRQCIISFVFGIIVIVLSVILRLIVLKGEKREYSFYDVNGYSKEKIYNIQSIIIETLSAFVSIVFAIYRLSILNQYTATQSYMNILSVGFILGIHILIVIISNYIAKRQLVYFNEEQLIKHM